MTVIVAIRDGTTIIMACDSAATGDDSQDIVTNEKLFFKMNGRMLIGFAGCFRIGQRIQYCFDVPEPDTTDTMCYMITQFVPKLQAFLKTLRERKKMNDSTLLIGFQGRIFKIMSDFSLLENRCGYDAIGDAAFAAMHGAMQASQLYSDQILDIGLYAARDLTSSTRAPFHTKYVMNS